MKSKQDFFSTVSYQQEKTYIFFLKYKIYFVLRILVAFHVFVSTSKTVFAQVVPDNTVNTQVDQNSNIAEITGGETRGTNLFHSFQDFSIQIGNEAFFNNAQDISNIFGRVTGGDISNIDGLIKANGSANLFLINPAGIVFGKGASLDIGGSFLATTADSINFDSGKFSAIYPADQSNISINFPIGLGFGSNPGNIEIEGEQNNVSIEIPSFRINTDNLPQGIKVNRGQNISLIGGNINFRGGGLQAPGGNIQLASINDSKNVDFSTSESQFNVNLNNISQFDNINFNDAAYVDVSDNMAGNIFLSGKQIILDDGSVILANTNESSNNSININASEEIKIQGTSGEFNDDKSFNEIENITSGRVPREPINNSYSISLIGADIFSETNSKGNDINVNSPNVNIFDAGQIRTVSFPGRATPGEISINTNSLLVEGTNNIDSLISSSINGGSVNIFSSSLVVKDGGRIRANPFNSENSGYLTIVSENITLQGYPTPLVPRFTGLFAEPPRSSNRVSNNNRESINIETKTLNVLDGAKLNSNSVVTTSSGNIEINAESITVAGFIPSDEFIPSAITSSVDINNAGENIDVLVQNNPNLPEASAVKINTINLSVLNGGRIEAINNLGDSGVISINARNIELNGTRPRVFNFIGGISTSTRGTSFGDGGNININTDSLKILNGSIIRAISLGSGDAGKITIDANNLEISGVDRFAETPVSPERVSKINTGSLQGDGGNIFINSDSVSVSDQGNIATSTRGDAQGGNVDIISDTFILRSSALLEANAVNGNGGNINIESDSILGLENSDITANAIGGDGGNITIDSNYIFGLVARAENTEDNDITASSELGLDGDIELLLPETLTEEELISLRELDFGSLENLISQSCFNSNTQNFGKIVNYGQNGLPENPENYFDDSYNQYQTETTASNAPSFQDWKFGDPVVEANIVKTNPDGSQYLVADNVLKSANDKICNKNKNLRLSDNPQSN